MRRRTLHQKYACANPYKAFFVVFFYVFWGFFWQPCDLARYTTYSVLPKHQTLDIVSKLTKLAAILIA
jgi:hypothetical protein